jgi:hypothetical protein
MLGFSRHGAPQGAEWKERDMPSQRLRAVSERRERTVLTVDAGSTGALSARFLTLVVRPHPAHEQGRTASAARPATGGLPAAS